VRVDRQTDNKHTHHVNTSHPTRIEATVTLLFSHSLATGPVIGDNASSANDACRPTRYKKQRAIAALVKIDIQQTDLHYRQADEQSPQAGWRSMKARAVKRRYTATVLSPHVPLLADSIISASLIINIRERKRSWNRPISYPVCRSVCLYVCPECIVAKRLI